MGSHAYTVYEQRSPCRRMAEEQISREAMRQYLHFKLYTTAPVSLALWKTIGTNPLPKSFPQVR